MIYEERQKLREYLKALHVAGKDERANTTLQELERLWEIERLAQDALAPIPDYGHRYDPMEARITAHRDTMRKLLDAVGVQYQPMKAA